MHSTSILSAVLSVFAVSASAASFGAPYVLSAEHEDYLMQLEQVAAAPDQIGIAARTATDLLRTHNAAEETLILPSLAFIDAVAVAPQQQSGVTSHFTAAMSQLLDEKTDVVTALVDVYAAALEGGQPEVSRLAEQMIWHETRDVQILYPAAALVGSPAQTYLIKANPSASPMDPGPIYGPMQMPMMGVGSPHAPAISR